MYITCPECNAKFVVTPSQIGTHGRKVKCSKCSHIWHYELDNNTNIEPELTTQIKAIPISNGVNLPALLPVKNSPYMYMLPVLMIGMILFISLILFPNQMNFGSMLNQDDLKIRDIQVIHNKEIDKITVSYKIYNTSLKDVNMPFVRTRLFNNNNRVVKSIITNHSDVDIAPNQYIQVQDDFAPAPPFTNNVDIMIGNKIDFILH